MQCYFEKVVNKNLQVMTNQEVMSQQQRALGFAVEGRFNEALSIIERNIRQHPGNSGNYYIKGRIHDELLQYESSITAYKKCLRKDKKNKKAKFNLGLAYLSLENFKEGCSFYQFRHSGDVMRRFSSVKPWYPKCRPGKVLIWAEQGIGDEVMFAQLIGNLSDFPHKFFLECDVRLHKIFSKNYPWLELIARNSLIEVERFDYQFPIGDLLKFFSGKLRNISASTLTPVDIEAVNLSTQNLIDKGFSLVGISWLSMNEEYGLRRSRAVELFCDELNPQNTAIINLQYLTPETELEIIRSRGFSVIDHFDCYKDLNAVFALISKCKKIITIDNSVAHFAGAIGAKTEVWLPSLPNWRWGVRRTCCYWYPNLTIKMF